jgi:hypothetical protein
MPPATRTILSFMRAHNSMHWDKNLKSQSLDGAPMKSLFFGSCFLICRTRSEDSADQEGGKAAHGRAASGIRGVVTQGEAGWAEYDTSRLGPFAGYTDKIDLLFLQHFLKLFYPGIRLLNLLGKLIGA